MHQFSSTEYDKVIEWIPFNRLCNIQEIEDGLSRSLFSATWLDGIRTIDELTQSRRPLSGVDFMSLTVSTNPIELLRERKIHLNYME